MSEPAIWRVYQNLSYGITITCPPGEDWPWLQTHQDWKYEVTQVEIRVHVYTDPKHEPVLDTGPAYITEGRRVRANGSRGSRISYRRVYAGTGREGDAVDIQAGKLDEQARTAALAAYRTFITSEAKRMVVRPSAR